VSRTISGKVSIGEQPVSARTVSTVSTQLDKQGGCSSWLRMRLGKSEMIVVALICFVAGDHAALAKPSHRACEAIKDGLVQTCHCHPKYDNPARHGGRLLAGFTTAYDVEKWEKAYRQGLAHRGSPPRRGRCLSSGI
jgi:hypothetical protein